MDIAKKIAKGNYDDNAVDSTRGRGRPLRNCEKVARRSRNKSGRRRANALAFKD